MESRQILMLAAAFLLLATTLVTAAPSTDAWVSECQQTEYNAYRACVHSRFKRQNPNTNATHDDPIATTAAASAAPSAPIAIIVNNTTYTPIANGTSTSLISSCQRLNFDCRIACGNDTKCEAKCPVCPENAEKVSFDYQTVVLESVDGHSEKFQARIEAGRNVTTIIRLTNIINNTNTIHMPTNVSTTNVNNVHVYTGHNGTNDTSSEVGGDYGLGYTEKGSCCIVVQAKTCAPSTSGPRCQHRRHKTCDDAICKARVMHAQVRRRCERNRGCHKKIVYVPEPGPQKCVHIDRWPHVVCGTVVPRKNKCDGCYDHYGYGFDNYHANGPAPDCRGCFDDAWDEGQRYRRGPVLRPYYYHQTPCYLTGTCVPVVDCGYGCYGDEFVDPAWGRRRRPYHNSDRDVYYEDEIDDDSEDTTVKPSNPDKNPDDTEEDKDDWVLEDTKCKVVSENGTIISNCTGNGLDDNEFAKEPNVNFIDDEDDEDVINTYPNEPRIRRHARHDPEPIYRMSRHRQADNMVDDDDDDVENDNVMDGYYNKRSVYNKQIADDFEYDSEMDHPYKRNHHRRNHRNSRNNRKHRRGGGRGGRGKRGQKSRARRHRKHHQVEEAAEE